MTPQVANCGDHLGTTRRAHWQTIRMLNVPHVRTIRLSCKDAYSTVLGVKGGFSQVQRWLLADKPGLSACH